MVGDDDISGTSFGFSLSFNVQSPYWHHSGKGNGLVNQEPVNDCSLSVERKHNKPDDESQRKQNHHKREPYQPYNDRKENIHKPGIQDDNYLFKDILINENLNLVLK